jgi:membrane-bound lytic murein transglycosylase B
MRFVRHAFALLAVASLSLPPAGAGAQESSRDGLTFDSYLQVVASKARRAGVSEIAISSVLAGLTPNDRVIALDRDNISSGANTSGFPPLAPYIREHVDTNRIEGGRRIYTETRGIASEVERRYGVPEQIIIAIWGHETNYGGYTGDFDLARALATLAWEGRRRELFEPELIDLMRMVDQGVPRYQLKGSWAGAFGNPQFLPSVYLRLAVDGDGDGRRDIWNSRTDTLHSIGNYFRDAGWRRGQPWGVRASIPAGLDWQALETDLVAPVCPRVHVRHSKWKTVAEWKTLGVQPQTYIRDETMASLFQPDGPGNPAWLLTQNYRVILEYNCSNYYAMSVGLLADEIVR